MHAILTFLINKIFPVITQIAHEGNWKTNFETIKGTTFKKYREKYFNNASAPFTALWYKGIKLWIYPAEEMSRCIYTQGYYEPNQMILLQKLLSSDSVFLDIGAHAGYFSLLCSKKVFSPSQIHAFEPSPRELTRLKNNMALNRKSSVNLYPVALSDFTGTTQLNIAKDPHTGHNTIGCFAYEQTKTETQIDVPCLKLDDWAKKVPIKKIDLIKIDAEGAETKILKGATETIDKFHPIIFIEIMERSLRHQGSSCKEIWDLLTEHNYTLYAYNLNSGLPFQVDSHPSDDYTDFIAIPNQKKDLWKLQLQTKT